VSELALVPEGISKVCSTLSLRREGRKKQEDWLAVVECRVLIGVGQGGLWCLVSATSSTTPIPPSIQCVSLLPTGYMVENVVLSNISGKSSWEKHEHESEREDLLHVRRRVKLIEAEQVIGGRGAFGGTK
jgi:hypothetical protein